MAPDDTVQEQAGHCMTHQPALSSWLQIESQDCPVSKTGRDSSLDCITYVANTRIDLVGNKGRERRRGVGGREALRQTTLRPSTCSQKWQIKADFYIVTLKSSSMKSSVPDMPTWLSTHKL